MKINKKSFNILKLSALSALMMLSSCSIPNMVKNEVKIPININFSKINNSFETKANVDGILPKIINDIKSYTISLCTDPNLPITTQVTGSEFTIDRDGSFLSSPHIITFVNPPVGGPYYATIQAWDAIGATGNNITKTANYGADGIIPMAVSSNSVSIDSSLALTFSDSPNNVLSVPLSLLDGLPAKVDAKIIDVIDGKQGNFGLNEFWVNTYNTDVQFLPSIAMNDSGNFVITWQSNGQDGEFGGIYAQIFDSFGNPVGSEIEVNETTLDAQNTPSVGMDGNNNFVVAWESNEQEGVGSFNGIYAKRFNFKGEAIGSEFQVNTETINEQRNASVAMSSSGQFVIAWDSFTQDGDAGGIYAQRYSDLGSPIGSEFQVPMSFTGDQTNPSIAINKNNEFVIAWQNFDEDGDSTGVYARKFDNTGADMSPDILVNTWTTGSQESPSVAISDSGEFVVTWQSNSQDGDKNGVYAQRFSNVGVAIGSEFRVNENTTNSQESPSITMDSIGNFIISWQFTNQDTTSYGIYARKFSKDTFPMTGDMKINSTDNSDFSPSIFMNNLGNYAITWSALDNDESITAKIFDFQNNPL